MIGSIPVGGAIRFAGDLHPLLVIGVALVAAVLLAGAVTSPLALPVLPVESYIRSEGLYRS